MIKINFRGGIISPGDLYNILEAAEKAGVSKVSFGLRQQLLLEVLPENYKLLAAQLDQVNIFYETDSDAFPNIVSSYPAEEVFITNTWLSEGVYKDILDLVDYQPKLKINISDSMQSFTPLLTGNINWVAAPASQHFWHLFIRFPKTNVIYEWKELVYTNDVARMSKHVEALIFEQAQQFYDNPKANGDELFALVNKENYITRPADAPAVLPPFNLPYYEGLNRYQENKYWLGIYRRDEYFSVGFLKALCRLCLQTKTGQFCSTPWKTIIVKSIEEKDRMLWNNLLARFRINVRHAANELNFQIEDDCQEGLELKNYLLQRLHKYDTRTFGICIGIKTRKKSEVFSSILIRKRPLINIFGIKLIYVYDILCANNFNPNERTGAVFSSNNSKFVLAEELRRAIFSFYIHQQNGQELQSEKAARKKTIAAGAIKKETVRQCKHCYTVYDAKLGEPENGIAAGTEFENLPVIYTCPLCEAPITDFIKIEKSALALQAV